MIDYIIPQPLVECAYHAQWHKDSGRGEMYVRTDRDTPERMNRKVLAGNIAEMAAYGAYCGIYGIPCLFPNLGKKDKPGKNIWPDDLIFMDSYKLGHRHLQKEHSVKGQFYTEAKDYKPSWIFQSYRFAEKYGDPTLKQPSKAMLFIGVLINDQTVAFKNMPKQSLECKIYSFFWPKILKHMSEPQIPKHKGSKKALYLKDICLKEIDHDTLQKQ